MIPYIAMSIRMNITSGRQSIWKTFSRRSMRHLVDLRRGGVQRPAVDLAAIELLEQIGKSLAMMSMTFNSRAFSAVIAALPRTAAFAHSTLR